MKTPLGVHGRRLPRYRNEPQPAPPPDDEPTIVHRSTAAGDTRKLRGIPAIGRGVSGAINNTTPGFDKPAGNWHYPSRSGK